MSLLVRPNLVTLTLTVPQGVVVTRVLVNQGIHLRELVSGLSRILVRMNVYGDVLLVSKLVYLTLMAFCFLV